MLPNWLTQVHNRSRKQKGKRGSPIKERRNDSGEKEKASKKALFHEAITAQNPALRSQR